MKGKCFKPVQDIDSATLLQLKVLGKRTFRTVLESCKSNGISMFEMRESTLKEINGNVSLM